MAFNSETRQKAYPVLDPYTGSDSGFIEESAYNKVSGRKGVLVGNWWEQDALERENESVVRKNPPHPAGVNPRHGAEQLCMNPEGGGGGMGTTLFDMQGHETRQVSLKQKRQLQSTLNLIGDRNVRQPILPSRVSPLCGSSSSCLSLL